MSIPILLRIHLVFSKNLKLIWQFILRFGQFFTILNGQILNQHYGLLVTLFSLHIKVQLSSLFERETIKISRQGYLIWPQWIPPHLPTTTTTPIKVLIVGIILLHTKEQIELVLLTAVVPSQFCKLLPCLGNTTQMAHAIFILVIIVECKWHCLFSAIKMPTENKGPRILKLSIYLKVVSCPKQF